MSKKGKENLLISEAVEEFGVEEMRLRKAIERQGLKAVRKKVTVERIFVKRKDVEEYLKTVRPGPRGPRKKVTP